MAGREASREKLTKRVRDNSFEARKGSSEKRNRVDTQHPADSRKKTPSKKSSQPPPSRPIDIEEGEDMSLALEVQAAALAFMKKLLEEQRDAQGLNSASDDDDEDPSQRKKKKSKPKKSREELQLESEKNLRRQQILEAKRARQVEREQREIEAAESRKKAEKRKGKLFADNDDMWDD
ncbi:Hypothetical protein, putative [Bodo saltans]|uniref:Uncharacterized protein n=1 Tax=Bodo saltans TaxID=75058 RepID=A0A0S4IHF7_BODSA|nr:Hypothetical protein, putative [Bodo saltans]|eukprot:CUE64802.1 Hypothetical protein, putative [Bodo saltans]